MKSTQKRGLVAGRGKLGGSEGVVAGDKSHPASPDLVLGFAVDLAFGLQPIFDRFAVLAAAPLVDLVRATCDSIHPPFDGGLPFAGAEIGARRLANRAVRHRFTLWVTATGKIAPSPSDSIPRRGHSELLPSLAAESAQVWLVDQHYPRRYVFRQDGSTRKRIVKKRASLRAGQSTAAAWKPDAAS